MGKDVHGPAQWFEVNLDLDVSGLKIKVAGTIRLFDQHHHPVSSNTAAEMSESSHRLSEPVDMTWTEELHDADNFTQHWPKRGGGSTPEDHWDVREGTISLAGRTVPVKVGRTLRDERDRLTVFIDRQPIAEFVETVAGTGYASVIKPDGKKTLRSDGTLPPLYENAKIEAYPVATGMRGIGVPNALAVIIDKGDYRSAIHHAAARWLGRRGYQLVEKGGAEP